MYSKNITSLFGLDLESSANVLDASVLRTGTNLRANRGGGVGAWDCFPKA